MEPKVKAGRPETKDEKDRDAAPELSAPKSPGGSIVEIEKVLIKNEYLTKTKALK